MSQSMLIIDDEEIVLNSCRKIFSAEGFHVVITSSPEEGLRLASDSAYDVILCDWKMPGFDGLDVVEELHRRSPESAVVMISGFPSVGRATEAMKRGAMDYVAKPFTPEEIMETVKKAVQRKLTEEKQALGRFEKILGSLQFPVPGNEDKAPKTIAETVASTIGVGKVTSPWVTVMILGMLAGAYIGFGGLLSTSVTFDMPVVIEPDALTLRRRALDGTVSQITTFTATQDATADGKTLVTLSFAGGGFTGSSLADGTYLLTMEDAKIHAGGSTLQGDGSPGGDYRFGDQESDKFFRIFGDTHFCQEISREI